MNAPGPPRIARALLRVAAPREDRDFIIADLDEEFAADSLSRGRTRATTAYLAQVMLSIPPLIRQRLTRPSDDLHPRARMLTDLATDFRQSVRSLRREPGFAAFTIAILALGIGVNSAMFGVVDRLLVRGPEHLRDAGAVRRIQVSLRPQGMEMVRTGWFPYAAYDAISDANAFLDVAAYSVSENAILFGRGADARRINRGEATPNLFTLFGVQPAVGRFFDAHENDVIAPQRVAVLGYGLWQREFAGRADAVGKAIMLDNAQYEVIGVAPKGFTGPDLLRVDVWLPESGIGRQRVGSGDWTKSWNSMWLSIVARLKSGISDAQADAEITALHQRAYGGRDSAMAKATLAVRPIHYTRDGEESSEQRVSRWLAAVAIIVLLIACANVVNLLLARAIRRQRELAVRLTLGAGRFRLIRHLLIETMTLAGAGGMVGLIVAYGVGTVMRASLIPGIEWPSGPVNPRVIGLSVAVVLLVGVVVGLVPAIQASAPDLSAALKAGVREGGGRRSRLRAGLTVAQSALSVVLLVSAGLFVISLQRVRQMDLGLQPDRVLAISIQRQSTAGITDSVARQRERDRRLAFYPEMLARLRARPDVEAASLTIGLPFVSGFGDNLRVPGRDSIPSLPGGGPFLSAVSDGYFATVGTRIVRGRAFGPADRAGSAPVAIINETMAETLWPGDSPIGKCFYSGPAALCAEIVGIAADTRRFRLREERAMAWYIPFGQEQGIGGTQLLIRPRGDPAHLLADIRREFIDADNSIVFVDGALLQDRLDPQIRPWRLGAAMFSLMGVLALVVAAAGLYSLISYFVTHRTHELGVRIALGAQTSNIIALVMRGGLGLAAGGIVAGIGLSVLTARWLEPLLFDTSATDLRVLAGVVVVLLAAATLASIVPALRAGRVNPIEAMRAE